MARYRQRAYGDWRSVFEEMAVDLEKLALRKGELPTSTLTLGGAMQAVTGNIACQAAAFVFKTDDTATRAWDAVNSIPHIRAEIHDDRAGFLSGLAAWNGRAGLEPDNAYLGIYAHMGRRGLSPARQTHSSYRADNRITWAEVATALLQGVHTCWLVGCGSVAVLNWWNPVGGPVRGRLLVTLTSRLWLPLVEFFAVEIDVEEITYPEEMPCRLRQALPKHGADVAYFDATPEGWLHRFRL
jgi:hypothetical protein